MTQGRKQKNNMARFKNGVSTVFINDRVSVVINHKLRTICKVKDGKLIERFNFWEDYTLGNLSQLIKSVMRDAKTLTRSYE